MKFPTKRYERNRQSRQNVTFCMEISKLFKSQSLVIIFAAASSPAAKIQNATSEGNSPRRKKQPRSEHCTEIWIARTAKPVSEYILFQFSTCFYFALFRIFPFFPGVES